MAPTVSVIIPAYNAAKYLAETIDSVINQSFEDIEILIIDDGSTDNTLEIANYYQKYDHRVRVISQSNQGVSATRNRGVREARGELIAFMDADDQWLLEKINVHVEHFSRRSDLGLSFARVEFMTSDGEATGVLSNSRLFELELQHFYYENLVITPSNAVFRRAVFDEIGGFNQHLSGTEDAEIFLRTLFKGWKAEGIDAVLVRYRTVQGGVSSNLYRMEEDWQRFSKVVQAYAPGFVAKHSKRAQAYFLRYLARRTIRSGSEPRTGLDFMNRALLTDWRLLLLEPKRTILTLLAVYGRFLFVRV